MILLALACTEYEFAPAPESTEGADTAAPVTPDDPESPEDEPPANSHSGAGVIGQVCDPSSSTWVVGAEAWIAVDVDGDMIDDFRVSDLTDSQGRYLLDGLPPAD